MGNKTTKSHKEKDKKQKQVTDAVEKIPWLERTIDETKQQCNGDFEINEDDEKQENKDNKKHCPVWTNILDLLSEVNYLKLFSSHHSRTYCDGSELRKYK